jgi:hypothetical protein
MEHAVGLLEGRVPLRRAILFRRVLRYEEIAARAYDAAILSLAGAFARLNFPMAA